MSRAFVVGLDGASWRLLEPWLEAGELPNIERIREGGVWATSRSCLPPVTFPNWKCYSSGKNPGKFGVFWFEQVHRDGPRITTPDRRAFDTAEFWDYLNDAGYQTGVVNMPTMYPPREIDGVVVCGGPDAVDGEYRSIKTGYTSPPAYEEWLAEEFDYRVHPTPLLSSNRDRGEEVEAILDLLELRFEVALDLFEREELDFIHVTLFYLNVLQHFFWDGEPTKRAWKRIDTWIGRLLELEDVNLFLMSDHGCAPTTTEFYINEWLAANGYLTKTTSIDEVFQRAGLTRENALSLAKQLGIVDLLAKTVPEAIQERVPQEAGAKRGRKLDAIDVESTKAIASGQGPIYLFDSVGESLRAQIIRDLQAVRSAEGEGLFAGVYRGEEVYTGQYVEAGPDIVLDAVPGVHINDGIGGGDVMTSPSRWEAENTREGIFAAVGEHITDSGLESQIDIRDLAPTILASFGVPIPRDMDGDVLPVFSGDVTAGKQRPIRSRSANRDAEREAVTDRLRDLGYMN